MNDFYIYEHWRPDTNQCFYVGKGRGKRAYSKNCRNSHWHNVCRKLGRDGFKIEIHIIETGLLEERAFELEMERIDFWKSIGVSLVNANGGGKGGCTPSEDTRAKISDRMRNRSPETLAKISIANVGNKNGVGNKSHSGRQLSDEHRAKISAANIGNKYNLGRQLSDEHRAKISAAGKGRKPSDKTRAKISAAGMGNKYGVGKSANKPLDVNFILVRHYVP